jgi:hypothetical protein
MRTTAKLLYGTVESNIDRGQETSKEQSLPAPGEMSNDAYTDAAVAICPQAGEKQNAQGLPHGNHVQY